MQNYIELGKEVIAKGSKVQGRNGTVYSLFGKSLSFDLRKGYPLMTTKYINFNHIKHETKWYLSGDSSIKYLKDNNVNIWNLWADENDDLGPTYGVQWRDFEGVDQVKQVIHDVKHNPHRRMIINGWNVPRLPEMALPPCLVMMQYHVEGNTLHSTVYQRSADIAIGVPYDIAEMALLQHIIANITGREVGTLTMFFGDIHAYEEHIDTFKKQLEEPPAKLPSLVIGERISDIDDIDVSNINVVGQPEAKRFRYKIKA